MNNLKTLQKQASFAALALKVIDPQYFHHNSDQLVIFGNFNQVGFKAHQSEKRHLGYQSILEAIAKVSGFNSYKSLKMNPPVEFPEETFLLALKSLNPYPLSEYQTIIWDFLMSDLVVRIKKGYHPQTFNFKRHEEVTSLGLLYKWHRNTFELKPNTNKKSNALLKISKNPNTSFFQDLSIIATSIFLTAIKTKITGYFKDNTVCENPSQLLNYGNNIHYLKTDPIPFSDCLIQQKWDQENFGTFRDQLASVFYELFNSKLMITGSVRTPLKNKVVVRLTRSNHNLLKKYQLEGLELERRRLTNYQRAALNLSSQVGISGDTTIYKHKFFKGCHDADLIQSSEIQFQLANWVQKQSNNKDPLQGTKAFWINISPSLIPSMIINNPFKYQEALTPEEYEEIIQSDILDQLYPIGMNEFECDRYYFRLTPHPTSMAIAYNFIHYTPQYITLKSESKLPKELAMLAIHAELSEISKGSIKIKGIHNKYIGYTSGDPNACPFENPDQFLGLNITAIQHMQKAPPAAPNPYEVEFISSNVIESIEAIGFKKPTNMEELQKQFPLTLRITLIDTLFKWDHAFDDELATIMVTVSMRNSIEYEFKAFKDMDANMRASVLDISPSEAQAQIDRELKIEQSVLDTFCIRCHLIGFVKIDLDPYTPD